MSKISSDIGFLATGDELLQGDILNTNSQYMVQLLIDKGMTPGQQLLASDDIASIERSLVFLLEHHKVVIVTGGLGPTSDDVTREAVSHLLDVPLEFNDASWNRIQQRLQSRGFKVSENNRRQCFFPVGSEILENSRGTADGFIQSVHAGYLIVLPGPPRECLPMFKQSVLPFLLKLNISKSQFSWRWLMMGLGESHIADRMESLVSEFDVRVGYRASYPYCEVKVFADTREGVLPLLDCVSNSFSEAIVSDDQRKASKQLLDYCYTQGINLFIQDEVTRGYLSFLLSAPGAVDQIDFKRQKEKKYDLELVVRGCDGLWSGEEVQNDFLSLEFIFPENKESVTPVRLNKKRTMLWVSEFVCWQCVKQLSTE